MSARFPAIGDPAEYALGLPVLVRLAPSGIWEAYQWDSAAGLEHVRALYETRASAEDRHAERLAAEGEER